MTERELREAIKGISHLQWSDRDSNGYECCPDCFAPSHGGMHVGSCDLKRLLDWANSGEPLTPEET